MPPRKAYDTFVFNRLYTFCLLLFIAPSFYAATVNKDFVLQNDSLFDRFSYDTFPLETENLALNTLKTYPIASVDEYYGPWLKPVKRLEQRNRKGLLVTKWEYEPFLSSMTFADTIIAAPELLPVVFDGKILPKKLNFYKNISLKKSLNNTLISRDSIIGSTLFKERERANQIHKLKIKDNTFAEELDDIEIRQRIRRNFYTQNPDKIQLDALNFSEVPIYKDIEKSPYDQLISANEMVNLTLPEIEALKVKQKHWKFTGEHELTIAQKYYTNNWLPQTNRSFHLRSLQKFNAIYRKNKIEFNHLLEWRLSVQKYSRSALADNAAPYIVDEDWLRTYNKLGLDAFIKKWSYIITLETKTPILVKKKQDDKSVRLASFLSPLNVNIGLGASYKYEWNSKVNKARNLKLAVDAAPLSVEIIHFNNEEVYFNTGGNKDIPKFTKVEFGSTLNLNLTYNINSSITINSRTKYFTNYERAYLEFENKVDMKLSRYFATSIYAYLKFDDSVDPTKKAAGWGYFSLNEVLSFGLNYKW